MKTDLQYENRRCDNRLAVTHMIEYGMISGGLIRFLIVVLLLVHTNIMENPANRVSYVAFTDIGNGVSTRIVDLYAIAPSEGTISTVFDIPDEVANKDYFVEIEGGNMTIRRGYLGTLVSLAGIGESLGVWGNPTGSGLNKIPYDWRGV